MATTIVTKYGSDAPATTDIVRGELAVDTENGRLYTENAAGAVVELSSNPSGNITFGDNGKAIFGAGSDLQIHHDGSNSWINEVGSGNLYIQGSNAIRLRSSASLENMLEALENGAVTLYYDNAAKLATTNTGIDVTGSVVADEADIGEFSTTTNVFQGNVGGTGARLRAVVSSNSNPTFSFDNDADTGMYTAGANTLNFTTGGVQRIRLDSAGDISFYDSSGNQGLFWDSSTSRLGLGATSLTHTLHVTGSHNEMALFKRSVSGNSEVKIDTTTAGDAKLTFANNGTSEYTMGRDNSDGAFKIADGGTIGSNDRLTINADGSSVFSGDVVASQIKAQGTEPTVFFNDTTTGHDDWKMYADWDQFQIQQYVNDTTWTSRLHFAANGNATFSGTATMDGLTVDGSGTIASFKRDAGANGQLDLSFPAQVATLNASSSLAFQTAATERMRLTSTGLGIGTSSPSAKLSLQTATGANNTSYNIIDATTDNPTYKAQINLVREDSSGKLGWAFLTNNVGSPTAAMNISAAGSVGIGTSGPSEKLHVSGKVRLNNGGDLYIDSSSGGVNYASTGARVQRWEVNGSERMRIDSSGNVGIGVSPGYKLHISGAANANDVVIQNSSHGVALRMQANTNSMNIFTTGAKPLYLGTNSTANQVVLDTSGNLLVGKTASDIATDGIELGTRVESTADGTYALRLNRKNSDGDIAQFRKDGSTVGSIGTVAGDIVIGTGACGIRFHDSTPAIQPRNSNGNANNDAIDIGLASNRFKDLHLSGGVYLGGTAAANKLDDYEEGTWTPTIVGSTSGSITGFTVSEATYTKIGDTVRLSCYLTAINMPTSTVVGNYRISGLPFSGDPFSDVINVSYCNMFSFDATTTPVSGYCGGSVLSLLKGSSISGVTDADEGIGTSAAIMLSIVYKV